MKRGIASRAFVYLKPYSGLFVGGQIATLLATAAGLVFPLITKYLVDTLLQGNDMGRLLTTLSILAGVSVIMMTAGYFKDTSLGKISQYIIRDVRQQVFEKLQVLKISYYENNKSGDIVSVMTNDINRFQDAISQGLIFVVSQLITLAAVIVMLLKLDLSLTAILVGLVPIALILARVMGKIGRDASRSVQERLGTVTALLSEVIRGIDVIKTFVLSRLAIGMFRAENDKVTGDSVKVVKIKALNSLLIGSIGALFLLTIQGMGAVHVFQGKISVGDLIAYIIYVQMIVTPLGMLSGIWMEIQKSFAAAERIFAVLDAEPEPGDGHSRLPLSPAEKLIEFKDVTFGYEEDTPVLKGVNFAVSKGETIALAGPSGAGKSSLIKLILRFYGIHGGSIQFHGRPLDEYDPEFVRNEVAVVMQDTHLFDMTVRENLQCGNPDATEKEIIRAAKQASAHDFISAMPDGYDTKIGEDGVLLSGGQRQRIAIARAFLKNPEVLLLDEATSSLDTESERIVQKALKKLMRGRTTIIISHRLSTIKNADRIYVIDRGAIESSGTHEGLRVKSPVYRQLCKAQEVGA